MIKIARLAQSVERKALNLVVVGSSPTVGVLPRLHGRPQYGGANANPNKWTHWDLNPGPSACEADVIPLHHKPVAVKTMVFCVLFVAFVFCLSSHWEAS